MNSVVDLSKDYDGGSQVYATCKQCNQSFENKTNLAKHMYLHREGFICLLCNKPFASESGLKRHINANHKNSKPIPICDICGQRFRLKRDLEKHHLDCHRANKYFRCRFCGAEFSWLTNLQKHEQFHENEGDQSNSEAVKTENSKSQIDYASRRKSVPSKTNDSNQDKTFKCQVCGKEFQFDFSYAIHLEGHKKAMEMENSKPSVADSPVNQKDNPSVEILLEVVPSERSANGEEIVSMKALEENDSANMSICEKDVSSDTSMMKILTDEEDVELFNYLKECKMRREIRLVRKRRPESPIYDCVMTEEKPFKCDLCGESFRWEVSLTIHSKVHVDGKALKFRKMYQKQDKPILRPRSHHTTKSVMPKREDKEDQTIEDEESPEEEEDDDNDYDNYDDEGDNSNCMEVLPANENENDLHASSDVQDASIVPKGPQTSDKDTAAKADKFLERMTDVLKTKWNPAKNKALTSKKNKIVGQVLLLDNNNKKLLLKDGKLVSEDGTHYLVSDGFLYNVNSQSDTQIEPVMGLMNDYIEPPNFTDVGQLLPDPDCMANPECDLSMNVTDA